MTLTGLLIYLFIIQVVQYRKYEQLARNEHWQKDTLIAERGRILDSKYRPLAFSQLSATVSVHPRYVRSADSVAEILSVFEIGEKSEIINKIIRSKEYFTFAKQIEYNSALKLKEVLKQRRFANCVVVNDAQKRIYPFSEITASIIGFTGKEHGLAGIENYFDKVLSGEPGWILKQKDAIGNYYVWPSYPIRRPIAGSDVVLTIDLDMQEIAYQTLRKYVENLKAMRGSVVILDAQDAAVLALVDYPDYDPNNFMDSDQSLWKMSAISDEFEPGSVFKLVICATALEELPHEYLFLKKWDVSKGYIEISNRKIKDVHNNGIVDFYDMFAKSSNIGVSLLSQEISAEKFYLMARKFGFGLPTGIELPGEANGYLDRPELLSPLRLANNSFGQGLRVTLIQLATAYLSVAHNGLLLKPYIVKKIIKEGKIIYQGQKKIIRRVMSEKNAEIIKNILAQVVIRGTGKAASLTDCQVCGKTGTSQKIEPNGTYSATKSIMTFVGFFPQEKPKFLIAVLIDEPQLFRFAGETTCPAFQEIAARIKYTNELAHTVNQK
ncbi:MAG: penicillin-binding protein 2 [candidate division WOR-3 bacterium]|nr:penicillin-binding protein 2 [candidate division WOR-3 bacterium]